LLQQIDFWVGQLKELGADHLSAKTNPLKEQVVAIGRRIASFEQQETLQFSNVTTSTDALCDKLKLMESAWDDLSNDALKTILKILIGRMELDFATGELDLELRLPSWAAANPTVFQTSLEEQVLQHSFFETPALWSVPLGTYRFLYAPRSDEGMILLSAEERRAAA
jgi:hypothetical protein